jgi:hypothetical protein
LGIYAGGSTVSLPAVILPGGGATDIRAPAYAALGVSRTPSRSYRTAGRRRLADSNLFSETRDGERSSREPVSDPVDELPDELRRIVQRITARQREGADA